MTTFPHLYHGNLKEIASGSAVIVRFLMRRAVSGMDFKPITSTPVPQMILSTSKRKQKPLNERNSSLVQKFKELLLSLICRVCFTILGHTEYNLDIVYLSTPRGGIEYLKDNEVGIPIIYNYNINLTNMYCRIFGCRHMVRQNEGING